MNTGAMVGADKEVGNCMWWLGVWDGEEGRICLSKVMMVEEISHVSQLCPLQAQEEEFFC